MAQPIILIDPHPRTLDTICDAETRRRLEALGQVVLHEDGPMPDARVEQHLEEAVLLFGQTAMPRERLLRAHKLRAIINVETNFLANIDYDYCFEHGIHVITPSSAFAPARAAYQKSVAAAGNEAPIVDAIETTLGWETPIYDPSKLRVISPVSRSWSVGWGGWVLFDWDTFFAATLASIGDRDLAYANAMEI